jgi:hypothetical protein
MSAREDRSVSTIPQTNGTRTMVQKRAICQRGVLWAFISVMFTPPGPIALRRADSKWRHSGGKSIETNDPAVVPGVINHRGGWWLRWDSITVLKLRPAHSSTKGRMSANRDLGDDIASGSAKWSTPHLPSRRTHLAKVAQGKEPWI